MQVQSTVASEAGVSVSNLVPTVPEKVSAPARKAKAAPEVVQLNRVNLRTFLVAQMGKFASVDYVKLDGSTRTLTGRLGVKAYLKGGQNNVEAADRPYLTMFDVQLCQYRTVNLSTISALRAVGKVYLIVD